MEPLNKTFDLECLSKLGNLPDGVIFRKESKDYFIFVIKKDGQVRLYFVDKNPPFKVSGIMSRIDLTHPAKLLGVYTQAMVLTLLWKAKPESIYLMGFGGGRLPAFFHHFFPEVVVESTETDPEVVRIAEEYFGLRRTKRLKVVLEDGREYLAKKPSSKKFDIILVDCFSGADHHPTWMATAEFYELCKLHLTEGGVLATNIMIDDPLYKDKLNTILQSFRRVYSFSYAGQKVFFGSDHSFKHESFEFEKYDFQFPFSENVDKLVSEDSPPGSKVLHD